MLTFRARWELEERVQRVYVSSLAKESGPINFPECTLNYTKYWFYAFVIWSPFSQSTLKASRNRNNVCCDSSTYRIPYGPVVKENVL